MDLFRQSVRLRILALVQKGLKIGRWGVGNKNPTSYNAEFWDSLRDRVGQVDRTNQGPDAAVAAANADAVGFMFRAGGEGKVGYENRGREDEDEGGASNKQNEMPRTYICWATETRRGTKWIYWKFGCIL